MVKKEILNRIAEQIDDWWERVPYPIVPSDLEGKWQIDFNIAVHKANLSEPLTEDDKDLIKKGTLYRYVGLNIDAVEKSIENDMKNSLKVLKNQLKSLKTTSDVLSQLNSFYQSSTEGFCKKYSVYYSPNAEGAGQQISEISREFQLSIVKLLETSKKDFITNFSKEMNDYQTSVVKRLEGPLGEILVHSLEEQVNFVQNTIANEKSAYKTYFDNQYNGYPEFILEYNQEVLEGKIEESWNDHSYGELATLIQKFKSVSQDLLNKFKAGEYTVFSPSSSNEVSRKALAEIAVSTLPAQFDQNYPLLVSLLTHLQVSDQEAIFQSHFRNNSHLASSGNTYLAHTTALTRAQDLFSLVLILSETYHYVKSPSNETKKDYLAVHREWIRQIVYFASRRDLVHKIDYTPKYTEWSLVGIAEQVIGESLQNWVTNDNLIDYSPSRGFTDWIKEFFKGDSEKVKTFALEKIKKNQSLHVTICISGWLSEEDDMADAWKHVVSQSFQGLTYSLRWDSSSYKELAFYDFPLFILSGVGRLSKNLFLKLFSKKFEENLPFSKRIGIAEATGMALAEHISQKVMGCACISILGFSLGTRVMYHCLQELHKKGIQVHDTYLLGGATPVTMPDWDKAKAASTGRFVNTYSKKDVANGFIYRLVKQETPIGSTELKIEGVENYNVTEEAGLHNSYRKNMEKVFNKIAYNVY